MKEPAISVAMATYNGERFLREQLDSLARQTLLPCELVACDDGSTDSTLDILHQFAAKAPFPVRIYQNEERLGHGLNFLRAASRCSGSLIAFCDQDDVWLGNKLQRCAEVMSETDSVLVIHSARVVSETLRPLGPHTPSARRLTRLDSAVGKGWRPLARRLGMAPGFTCVFRSMLLSQIPAVPPLSGPRAGHEYWLFFAAEVIGSVTLLPDVLALYRKHGRNTTGLGPPYQVTRLGVVPLVAEEEYSRQAETAELCAGLLADAATRLPDLRQRLARAQHWYGARARSLARRAALYGCGRSFAAAARCLITLIVDGSYRAIPMGGLGSKALGKDLAVSLLPGAIKYRLGGPDHGRAATGL